MLGLIDPTSVSIIDSQMNKARFIKSASFVFIQFLCLGLIAITGSLFPANQALLVIELLGLALGIWAILTMRIGNFNITPDPFTWSELVTSGPYRLIRHPMYLALLLTTLPLVINDFDLFRIIVWLVLLIVLLLKLNYEENLLVVNLAGYEQYFQKSYRLIPYLY
jgi:protein-S-isoprenylcysteine O-methyltransferase Ste14